MNDTALAKELVAAARELTASGRYRKELASPARRTSADEDNSLDGMTKVTAKNNVNRLLARYTKGFFTDDSWRPVHQIWKAMTSAAIDWEVTDTEYRKNDEGRPASKRWKFEVNFNDKSGRPKTLHGVVVAAGAGSVEDPLDRYDLVAYVS